MTAEEMTAFVPGNTNAGTNFRARSFQFTLNDISKYEELKTLLTSLKTMTYFISCLEKAPTTGHEHIHIYTHFSQTYKISKKILAIGSHIEICKGSPKQNIEYITKDGNILDEIGEKPKQGSRYTITELKNIKDENELEDWHVYNTWKKIQDEINNDIDIDEWHKDIKVIYIYGPSGVGKTERAKQYIREHKNEYGTKINVVKYENGFWSGVGNARIAIYDDFRDSHMKPSEFINFIDYNIHTLNIKGGQKQNKYELIIITSVQPLDKIYKNISDEPRKQWMRRIEPIKLGTQDDNDNDIDFDGYVDDM